jgi:MFS family permease
LRIGIVIFGLGFMALSQINSIITFYLSFAMIAIGSSLGGFATVMVAVVSWFNKNRAKAISISQIGFSAGGLAVPIVILSLEFFGWRVTAFASGVLVLLMGLPFAQIVRHRPEAYGEVQDGYTVEAVNEGDSVSSQVGQDGDFTAKEAMRTRAFWLISIGHASALLTVSAIMVHLVPHLTEGLGYSLPEAGAVVALMTACQMFGQLYGGYLGDRLDKRFICIACMMGHTLGLLLLAFADSVVMVVAFALLHGIAWGMRGPLMVALRADYFGPSSFGTIMGFSSLIVMFGMSSGALIAGYMADISGSYTSGLTLLAFAAFLGSFCFLMATRPVRPVLVAG